MYFFNSTYCSGFKPIESKCLLKVYGWTYTINPASCKVFASTISLFGLQISYTQLTCWCNTLFVNFSICLPDPPRGDKNKYFTVGLIFINLSISSLLYISTDFLFVDNL